MTYIIAEAGVNHGGAIENAYRLIWAASGALANAVKFQLFSSKVLWGDERIKHLELARDDIKNLKNCAEGAGIDFLCTPFDLDALAFLIALSIPKIKVASGMLRRKDFLHAVRDTGLPVILSTGMATLPEINEALLNLGYGQPAEHKAGIAILHCTSAYPCPLDQVNLTMLDVYRHQWGRCEIGYSDHTPTITASVAAVVRGATIIEKHLTLDRSADGPDHKASIEPAEFKRMVEMIREVEQCLVYSEKKVMPAEIELRKAWK